MPVLSVPESPTKVERSPFQKATPFVISMGGSTDPPIAAPPLLNHASSLDMETFGQPKKIMDEKSKSPRPKLRAYQAHLESMSPKKDYKAHVRVNAQELIAKYQQEQQQHHLFDSVAEGPLPSDATNKVKHAKHRHHYPESDDENIDWTESNEDPLDHDASANGFENFGQPAMETLTDVTESPKRKMRVYLKVRSPHATQAVVTLSSDAALPGMPCMDGNGLDPSEDNDGRGNAT